MRLSLLVLTVALLILSGLPSPRGGRAEDEIDAIEVMLKEPLPLADFLKAVGMVSGFSYVWDPGASALKKAELVSARNLTAPRDEFSDLVRGLLASYDLVLVPLGPEGYQVYRVVDLAALGRSPGLLLKPVPVELGDESLAWLEVQDGLYVTATVSVDHLQDLDAAAEALGRLATGHGIGLVVAVSEARALVVTDFAPTLVRLHRVILELDERARLRAERTPETPERYEVVALEHADAMDLAPTLVAQFAASAPESRAHGDWVRIHGDERTNQLLVRGTPARVEQVLEVVKQVDLPEEKPRTYTHVLRLEHLNAEETAMALVQLLRGDVRIVPHEAKNALLITSTPSDFEQIKAIVDQLDSE